MQDDTSYILVDPQIVPEVFLKVLEAKKLVAKGIAKNYSQAAKLAGISRSTFYKYKDSISYKEAEDGQKTVTLVISVLHEPGTLSGILKRLSEYGANILTLNQTYPVDGAATVSATLTIAYNVSENAVINSILELPGAVEARIIAQ